MIFDKKFKEKKFEQEAISVEFYYQNFEPTNINESVVYFLYLI